MSIKFVTTRFYSQIRTQVCAFSGFKIPVAKGRKYVRLDLKSFTFINKKSLMQFLRKTNPRKVFWTAIYRQLNKKGQQNELVEKKKTRRVIKVNRGYAGISAEEIAKRKQTQSSEVLAKKRNAAIKEIKEKKAENAAKKEAARKEAKANGKKATNTYKKSNAKLPKAGHANFNSR
ncbi:60S ribosomal protein L24, putative [Entamoeba dispar SAW760]|uniref:60S ribosomal protein L24, putative n=1 Tax=Entamoeba dispar (strain ATCC PRA-260 / SAW760) TaxID=370354 RepID=B0EDB8_ENTDS|nr:60S ribosomal protein L24, putative [Entamoeba dispar SAW760]EDR27535.1 60S ribosomal protein L24, putative [Entamoeba dispar SAW760]|eukprot:EDR27535.1 60S ribosomal protein L24, putative [Entamoeba dispar SAW760]